MRFAARIAAAASMALVVAHVVDSANARAPDRPHVPRGVAVLVAVVAVLEAAQVPSVMSALTVFRPGFHVVGGQLRATGTFFYPTIASMYLEVAFALGLWLLYADRRSTPEWIAHVRRLRSACDVAAGIAATFTRAGLFGMAAALAGRWRCSSRAARHHRRGNRPSRRADRTLVTVVLALRSPELLLTRMSTEGSQAWYGARYEVPPTLDLDTGSHAPDSRHADQHRAPDVGFDARAGIRDGLSLAARRDRKRSCSSTAGARPFPRRCRPAHGHAARRP